MLLWIVYFVLSGVILYQVVSILRLSDKVESLQKNEDYRFHEYLKEKEENNKNKDILENIKNSMPF